MMDMVRHQAVCDDFYTLLARVIVHESQVRRRVAWAEKHAFASIAPLCNVMGYSWNQEARVSRHGRTLARFYESVHPTNGAKVDKQSKVSVPLVARPL